MPEAEARRRLPVKSGLEIAQEAELRPITEIAASAGIPDDVLEPFGRYRAKVDLSILDRLADRPTASWSSRRRSRRRRPARERPRRRSRSRRAWGRSARTSCSASASPRWDRCSASRAAAPAAATRRSCRWRTSTSTSTATSTRSTAAHNLLASALDASLYFGNPLGIDLTSITWPRTLDVNARELRYTVIGLGGKMHGVPRENGFVITAASEVMAMLALASDLADLRARLGRIVVASTTDGEPVTAEQLQVAGAMTVIMKDALKPNLVQTLEGQPVLIHAGPFGNVAHANNSIIEDRWR
jgi:formate--tetrahydrofolate ligase